MTIPAIEPPLNLEPPVLEVLAAELSRPEVVPGAATVIVFTWPPAAVVSLTMCPVVVVVSEVEVVCFEGSAMKPHRSAL